VAGRKKRQSAISDKEQWRVANGEQEASEKQTSGTITLCTNSAYRYQNIISDQ
jgi:hypothetical protein